MTRTEADRVINRSHFGGFVREADLCAALALLRSLKPWSAPVVIETTPQEPAPTPDFVGSTQPQDHRDWAHACVAYAAHAASSQPSTAAIRSHMHAWNPEVIMARTHLKSLELSGRVYTDPSPEGRIPAELQSRINASAAHLRKVERAARASLKGRLINR